jgi:hypothetical protein
MPKSTPGKLAYMKEYNKRPERKEAGVELRKKAFDNGGKATKANTDPQDASKNRGWRRSSGYKVPNAK